MNQIEKITQMRRQYIMGLQDVIESAIKSGDEQIQTLKAANKKNIDALGAIHNESIAETIKQAIELLNFFMVSAEFTWRYGLPAHAAEMYKLMYDPKSFKQFVSDKEIGNLPINEVPDLENIFEHLTQIQQYVRDFLIANLRCGTKTKIELSDSLNSKDREAFENCVLNSDINIDILQRIIELQSFFQGAFSFPQQVVSGEQLQININDISDIPSILLDTIPAPNAQQSLGYVTSNFEILQSMIENLDFSRSKELRLSSYHSLAQYQMARYEYRKRINDYTKEEQELFNQLYVDDTEIDLYKEAIKDGFKLTIVAASDGNKCENDEFCLSIFNQKPDSNKSLYFNGLHDNIVAGGDDKFKEFVNYIADSGYIDNTSEAKQLFTFRLTGRCKPSGELPKLLWDGKERRSPNELIFIIRFATDNSKKKYRKMEAFFDGPIFPNKDISAYADQARKEFRDKLCEFYPGVFRIKDISQY